jgi:hypothetical protein
LPLLMPLRHYWLLRHYISLLPPLFIFIAILLLILH